MGLRRKPLGALDLSAQARCPIPPACPVPSPSTEISVQRPLPGDPLVLPRRHHVVLTFIGLSPRFSACEGLGMNDKPAERFLPPPQAGPALWPRPNLNPHAEFPGTRSPGGKHKAGLRRAPPGKGAAASRAEELPSEGLMERMAPHPEHARVLGCVHHGWVQRPQTLGSWIPACR